MAKSLKDILMTPIDTDLSAEGFRRAFGISDYVGKSKAAKRTQAAAADMKKRITEGKEETYGLRGKPYTDKTALDPKTGDYTKQYEEDSRRGLNTWTTRGTEKRKAELSNTPDNRNFSITPKGKKPNTVKVTKKETSVETPTGNIGAASGEIGPDMGRVNREAPVLDLSTQASADDIARIKGDDRSTWVDPHEQARRMMGFKKGGAVKAKKKSGCGMKSGGSVKSSASRRADGCAQRGKTRGRMV